MIHQAYLSIGSNMDNPILQCFRCIYQLHRLPLVKVVKRSSLYETEPYGYEKQDWFINLVVMIESDLDPWQLLSCLQGIERDSGKKTEFRWGPRVIDIDILLYDSEQINDDKLRIPHPLMHLRRFVLYPLAEIAEDLCPLKFTGPVRELLSLCPDQKEVRRIEYVRN